MPAVWAAAPAEFIQSFCVRCHGPEKQKGDRRFDGLRFPLEDQHGVLDVQDIIDQLTLGDMPPKKADQPSTEEKAAVIAALTEAASEARARLASTGGQTVLRRLNRREYRHTVSDLFALDMTAFDPTSKFPRDQMVEHMDNVGDTLVTSGHLLDQYLDAADLVVEKALGTLEQPEEQSWHFEGNFVPGAELKYAHKSVYQNRYLCVYEVPNTLNHEGGYSAISDFKHGVPVDGTYEVRVLAHSVNRQHPYDPDIFKIDPDQRYRLGIVPGDLRVGTLHHPQPIEPQLAEVTVNDGEPQWHTMTVRLEQGQTPRFIFPNGMANCRKAFGAIVRRYKEHWPEKERKNTGIFQARRIVLKHGKMPHIRIHEVKIRGPIHQTWPTESQRLILGADTFHSVNTRAILHRFADRAYRRPATASEIDRLMAVVETRLQQGNGPFDALKDGLKAALCSPAFLYLSESGIEKKAGAEKASSLSPHDLASRLSYFLWATTPDAALRQRADDGSLAKLNILSAEVERLLASPRSEAFVSGFLDSWLNLRALGDMPPDRSTFGDYYAKDLQNVMKRETQHFMRHMITEDRPITEFLDADYTFLNKPLAKHYQLPATFAPDNAHRFQKVALTDRRRGGLLGMGSVLTVTANGIETSPVTRGVWLLENILGTPPAPPPDDVPPIDPDVRGAKSIRDQLAKHRDSPACYECHRKIDPPGFALENFDPVGAWRTHYPMGKKRGPLIDASSEFPNGDGFQDIAEFKSLLLKRQKLFARMLTGRLLTYATGRRMEALDRPEIERIVSTLSKNQGGLRRLIHLVVQSPIFRSP